MILTPEVLAILIINTTLAFFAFIAFILSVKIYLNWDLESSSTLQYKLEKQSYLTATIIKYIFIVKVPLFLFFIFTLDKISNILIGAMCGAGVVDATEYGTYLFVLKIINLYIFAYWLALNSEDIKHENQPYTKQKFGMFIIFFLFFMVEVVLEGVMFSAIDVKEMVDCCGTIYSTSSTTYIADILKLSPYIIVGIFYTNFLLIILFYFLKRKYIFSFLNLIFIITSLISLIAFFGTYIYQLPTHHCPFCFLQKDYNYVGYIIYIFLFVGTFFGMITGFVETSLEELNKKYKISLWFNILYVVLVTSYVVVFFIRNGVWL